MTLDWCRSSGRKNMRSWLVTYCTIEDPLGSSQVPRARQILHHGWSAIHSLRSKTFQSGSARAKRLCKMDSTRLLEASYSAWKASGASKELRYKPGTEGLKAGERGPKSVCKPQRRSLWQPSHFGPHTCARRITIQIEVAGVWARVRS